MHWNGFTYKTTYTKENSKKKYTYIYKTLLSIKAIEYKAVFVYNPENGNFACHVTYPGFFNLSKFLFFVC